MELKISQVSKMTGLSASGIRFLEQEGILEPSGGRKGNCRSYGLNDVSELLHCRNMRECGLSLKEISELEKKNDLEDYYRIYDKKELELEEELQEKMRLLHFLHMKKAEFHVIQEKDTFLEEVMRPAILFYPLYADDTKVTEWPEPMEIPYADSALVFDEEILEGNCSLKEPQLGIGMLETESRAHSITKTGRIQYFGTHLALHCIAELDDEMHLKPGELDRLQEALKSRKPTGLILSKRIVTVKQEGKNRRFDNLWVDVRE